MMTVENNEINRGILANHVVESVDMQMVLDLAVRFLLNEYEANDGEFESEWENWFGPSEVEPVS